MHLSRFPVVDAGILVPSMVACCLAHPIHSLICLSVCLSAFLPVPPSRGTVLWPNSGDGTVPSYRIEVFTASSTVSASGSKFGQSEVQTITTEDVAEGTFTLAFGPAEYALPGTVDVVAGEDLVITSEDLTPFVKRGDRVAFDGGWEYEVHAFMPFNASHLYLAQVTVGFLAGSLVLYAPYIHTLLPSEVSSAFQARKSDLSDVCKNIFGQLLSLSVSSPLLSQPSGAARASLTSGARYQRQKGDDIRGPRPKGCVRPDQRL